MVNLLRLSSDWMKMAWARQPVLVVSCTLGVIGRFSEVHADKHCGALYLEQILQVLFSFFLALALRKE